MNDVAHELMMSGRGMRLSQKVSKLILSVYMGYNDFLILDKIPDR